MAAGRVFDDCREADAPWSIGEVTELKLCIEHETVWRPLQRKARRFDGEDRRHSGAIAGEAISGPGAGWREVAFHVCLAVFRRDECFEAGVAP